VTLGFEGFKVDKSKEYWKNVADFLKSKSDTDLYLVD
jgi:hypothetical protein